MDNMTIMLAGYSNPYPWRSRMASGDGVSSLLYKAKPVKSPITESKLAWLYSNGGIKQTSYISGRTNWTQQETFPFEYSQKEGRKTCDIQDTKLPDSNISSNVSDAIISSMLRKIWYDFHPTRTSERWEKMRFPPILDPLTETLMPAMSKTDTEGTHSDKGPNDVFMHTNSWTLNKENKRLKKKGLRSAIRSLVRRFRRAFGNKNHDNNNNNNTQ